MNNNFIFEINIWVVVISAVFRVLAAIDFLHVIWFAWKEVLVKNGLKILREQLLTSSTILFLINTVGLLLIIIRPFSSSEIYLQLSGALAILNSVGFWIVGRIKRLIYTQSYTPEQKYNHSIIDKLESGDYELIPKRKGVQ
jgi:positive regulator of sigma E activity